MYFGFLSMYHNGKNVWHSLYIHRGLVYGAPSDGWKTGARVIQNQEPDRVPAKITDLSALLRMTLREMANFKPPAGSIIRLLSGKS